MRSWLVGILHVGKVGINRARNYFAAGVLEVFSSIVESADFGWAYECEIEWIEK